MQLVGSRLSDERDKGSPCWALVGRRRIRDFELRQGLIGETIAEQPVHGRVTVCGYSVHIKLGKSTNRSVDVVRESCSSLVAGNGSQVITSVSFEPTEENRKF